MFLQPCDCIFVSPLGRHAVALCYQTYCRNCRLRNTCPFAQTSNPALICVGVLVAGAEGSMTGVLVGANGSADGVVDWTVSVGTETERSVGVLPGSCVLSSVMVTAGCSSAGVRAGVAVGDGHRWWSDHGSPGWPAALLNAWIVCCNCTLVASSCCCRHSTITTAINNPSAYLW